MGEGVGAGAGAGAGVGRLYLSWCWVVTCLLVGRSLAAAVERGPGAAEHRAGKQAAGSVTQGLHHPGIIVTVVIVTLLGFISATCIAKRYCFPQSHQTFMYSSLRQYEELNILDGDALDRDQTESRQTFQDLQE